MGRAAKSGLPKAVLERIQPVALTMDEAQAFSGLGRNALLGLLRTGEVQGRRGGRRRWLILRDSLEAWLRGGSEGGEGE